jgi:hypothetical protein
MTQDARDSKEAAVVRDQDRFARDDGGHDLTEYDGGHDLTEF